MFHDRAYIDILAVTDRIYIDFNSVLKETVYKYGMFGRKLYSCIDVTMQACLVINYGHGPSAKHIRGPYKYGVSYIGRDLYSIVLVIGNAVFRLPEFKLLNDL